MLTTGPFDTVSDISKERTKLNKVYGTLTWNSLPYHIRNVVSLVMFKYYMRKWKPNNCPYRVCKICLNGVGYTGVSQVNMSKTVPSYRRLVEMVINK